jgi:outer membrane biosynthesis protein TonB
MLHWQHKSARKRLSLWFKLTLISLFGHVAALALLFFVYRGSTLDMALTVRAAQLNTAIDVIWVSQLPNGRRATAGKSVGKIKGKKVAKKTAAKSSPKTELKSDIEEKKKAKKKETAAKLDKKKTQDKTQSKKIEKPKVEEKKPEIKKPELAKQPEEVEEKKLIPEPIKNEDKIESSVDAKMPDQPISDGEDLNFEISGSYRDLEALQQFQELQQEISRCWRPPVGIAQTVCCQIKVTFDWEGKVTQMETVKPSGILMFDVSSRNAVAAMEAPKFVRGKTFTITFKP